MWINRLRAAPWALALAAALLAVPWAQAQRVRQFPSMAFRTGMTANQMTTMNSVMFPRTVFNPPFYSVLAARNPLLLASGLANNSPFFNNMGFGIYSSMANPYLRNSLPYNRMLYGTYGMGYGGYGMGYGYNPALYSAPTAATVRTTIRRTIRPPAARTSRRIRLRLSPPTRRITAKNMARASRPTRLRSRRANSN